jgi:hypothetical protein
MFEKAYVVPANDQGLEALTIVRGDGGQNTLKLKVKGKEYSVGLKQGEWQTGMLAWGNMPEEPVAASGAWATVDTYTARLTFYETPFLLTLTLKFNGDTVQIDREMNVGGGTKPAPVTGKVG